MGIQDGFAARRYLSVQRSLGGSTDCDSQATLQPGPPGPDTKTQSEAAAQDREPEAGATGRRIGFGRWTHPVSHYVVWWGS